MQVLKKTFTLLPLSILERGLGGEAYLHRLPRLCLKQFKDITVFQDTDLNLLAFPVNFYIENLTEAVYLSQRHLIPAFRQTGCKVERAQTGGTNTKYPFGKDAGIQSALCGEMLLAAFRPRLNRIRNMLAEQTAF
jgi:hypothetical protein